MTEYFVDPVWGDDDAAGTPAALPWRTFKNVNVDSFSAGDRIKLKKGNTYREEIVVPSSGSAGLPIVIEGYSSGTKPLISGSDRAHGFRRGTNLITNPSFEGAWSGSPTAPSGWTAQESGTSDVAQETSDVYHSDASVSIAFDAVPSTATIATTSALNLVDSSAYRLTIWHKDPPMTSVADLTFLSVIIYRTGGSGNDDYLAPNIITPVEGDGNYWNEARVFGIPVGQSPWWTPWQIDFNTGANTKVHTDYYVKVTTYAQAPYNVYKSKTFLFDAISLINLGEDGLEFVEDGGFENWTPPDLDSWTVTEGEPSSTTTQVTVDPISGLSSVAEYIGDDGNGFMSTLLWQQLEDTLEDESLYTVNIRHTIDTIALKEDARLAVVIWRNNGTPGSDGEFLYQDLNIWSNAEHAGVPLQQLTPEQAAAGTVISDSFTFYTGIPDDPLWTGYYIGVGPYQVWSGQVKYNTEGKTFTFDNLSLRKEVTDREDETGNLLTNWSFENWTDGVPDDWTLVNLDDATGDVLTTFEESDAHRIGAVCPTFTMSDLDADVGLKQTGITLTASTTYRFGCHTRTVSETTANTLELGIQIMRESDSFYWDGAAWTDTTAVDATSEHMFDWGILTGEVTTEAGADTYTMYIHRAAGTFTKAKEEMFFDAAFIQEKDIDVEVWALDFKDHPRHVWVSGTIGGETMDHEMLEDETQTSKQTGDQHPHYLCYSYDSQTQTLYVNVGKDPTGITFECSVRDTCVNVDEESYITVDGLKCYRAKKNSVAMGHKLSPRATEVQVTNCDCWYTGETAIQAGYLPDWPYEGGVSPAGTATEGDTTRLVPSELVMEGNDIYRYGDGAPYFIRCATAELLADPDFEDWDSATNLEEWDETHYGSASLDQETGDVWRGSSSVKFTCDGTGLSDSLEQIGLGDAFSGATSATVSFWYKTPDWDEVTVTDDVFGVFILRTKSGLGYDEFYRSSTQTWSGDATHQKGIPLTQSVGWTEYTLDFAEGANPNACDDYGLLFAVYQDTKAGAAGSTFFIDQASFSKGKSVWSAGTSYGVPTQGITVTKGGGLAGGCGNVTVRKNKVDGNQAFINFSGGKNGIVLRNGGGTNVGSIALIEQNEVTRASHAIVALGEYSLQLGEMFVTNLQIRHNYVHDTGDDGIWIDGLWWPYCKICYNVISNTGDNCIDYWASFGVEIYNNSFNANTNEALAVTSGKGIDPFAFVYNNVFYNWGSDWIDGAPGKRRGSAIGFYLTGGTNGGVGYSLIDYNMYYSDDDPTMTDHPFHIAEVETTGAEWLALGFDTNGIVDDPEYTDPDNNDLTVPQSSPVRYTGVDLSELDAGIEIPGVYTYVFDKNGVIEDCLDVETDFPDEVEFVDQSTLWNKGAYGFAEVATSRIIDDTASFPVDGSLLGVTVYVVDSTDKRIWKGSITGNIATELYVDQWEGVFNADGVYPGGNLAYYVGYIYLYDRTPQHAFINDHWGKKLTEHELLTNNVAADNFIFFRRSINHGQEIQVEAGTLSGDRMTLRGLGGYHRNFQHEHALLTNQEIRIKEMIYHGVWTRGKMDQ